MAILTCHELEQQVEAGTPKEMQTVYIIDDDEDVLQSLKFLIEGYHIPVKTYVNAEDFLDEIEIDSDCCVVIDIRMPGTTGMELFQLLKERHALFPIIMLTAHGDVPVAVEAMKAGAFDFLLKSATQHEIVTSIQRALKHSRGNKESLKELAETRTLLETLSKRELEVLEWIIEGLTSRQICLKLDIRVKTVDAHRASIMRKMKATNVADLINKVVTYRNLNQNGKT